MTLSFTAFELEASYDFLYIYDGPTTASTLIGTYSGTTSPGTITSSGNALTVKFTSDSWTTSPGWEATWTCATNTAPTTTVTLPGTWFADDFTASFTDTDNTGSVGIDSRFYQVLEFDGTQWGTNRDNGFLFETFDYDSFPNWTQQTGNWYLLNNRIHQTDTVSTNTNLHIDVAQDNSGQWMYSFSARMWNSIASQNRRFGIHVFADAPNSTNRGNSYLVWFRQDNQTLEIYETENNVLNRVLIQPLTTNTFVWYDYRITYDPATGEIKVWRDGQIVGSWTDPTPIQAGSHVSLRCNMAHIEFDEVRVFKERGATTAIKVGPAATEDCRYESPNVNTPAGQVFGISLDGNDRWSNMDFRNFYVDWTVPGDPSQLADGPAMDIDTVTTPNELAANWTSATESNSAIARYWYAIGTSPGATDLLGWTDGGDTAAFVQTTPPITHGITYYVAVKAENLSGLESGTIVSDGQLYWNPISGAISSGLTGLKVYPNPVNAGSNGLHIELPGAFYVELVGIMGQVLQRNIGNNQLQLNMSSLAAGVYLLRIQDSQGNSGVVRVVRR